MKTIFNYLFILTLLVSCKDKITSIKLSNLENNKKYRSYILKYAERPDSIIIANSCPWIKDPVNTVFLYMPISFKLENNTGRDLRISKIWDNYSIGQYRPVFIDNKYFEDIEGKASISSGNNADITLFVHLPVHKNLLDKEHYERLFPAVVKHKQDSIVINKINPQLQKEINLLLKKKSISAHLYEDNDFYGGALVMYCVAKQKSETFKMDSLSKQKTSFRYNCE